MARYEAVIPGLAERLISRFEKQSDHRMALESEVIQSDTKRANLGLAAGFIVAVVSIASSAYVIVHRHDVAGTVLGGGTLASLVGTFVYGSQSRKQERLPREKLLLNSQEKRDSP